MQNNLSKQERQRVSNHFGTEEQQHPLLQVCSVIFKLRAGKLEGNKVKAEDVFCLVAGMLDLLFSNSKVEAWAQQDIDDLWCEQTQLLLDWPDTTVNDRQMIVDTEFRIVRKLLCHHWDTYYSEWLYSLFSTTIDSESKDSNKEEQQRIQERLSDFSEQLNEWVNNVYDGHLSEEVEAVMKGEKAKIKPLKPHSGRKSIDIKDITASFNYLPRVEHRAERLQVFHKCLNGVFIDADLKDFLDMFQNKTTIKKIVWIRSIKELQYLFNKLEESGWVSWPKSYGKWQMVCARFQIRSKVRIKIDDGMTDDSFETKDLQLSQFNKGGKMPTKHDELDKILLILSPDTEYGSALDDYLDYKEAQGEHDGIKDTADALANGLNTDIKI